MNVLFLVLVLGLGVIVNTKTIETSTKGKHQCEYNGGKYNEGEEIISARRLCLSCKCSKDFIEPNDYNCTVIECQNTEPIQRGCQPIYDDVECCPVDYNCTGAQPLTSQCNERYYQHYTIKGCTPVFANGSKCPVRFDCSKVKPQNDSVCIFNGQTFQKGESIDVGNPCKICSCRENYPTGLHIDCIFVECPHLFGHSLNDSCYNKYEEDQCCPSKVECASNGVSHQKEKMCEYEGSHYHFGEQIYPKEDRCQSCLCNEHWTGVGGNSCRSYNCELEMKKEKLLQGCIPIYHEATCCPIEIYCGSSLEGYKNTTVSFAKKDEIDSGTTCVFKGIHYSLGQTLNINHPTNCVTCTCNTPPDFTCVHKSCPRPPNDDYDNCMVSYKPGECCPTYDCKQASGLSAASPVPVVQCSPVVCPEGCSEVTVHNSCPFCMCHTKLCTPPKCEAGCTMRASEGECPVCDCPNTMTVPLISCAPVKCADHCFEVTDSSGCPVCMCGPVCTPPKCEPDCELQKDVPGGECPRCNCPKRVQGQLQCSPVQCLAGCVESIGDSGCPSCECKPPLCSPPKCEEGCYLNPFPTGPCPECVCEDKESVPQLLCSPVKCGPLCHEAYDKDGCSTCICDPQCTVPVCENDCHLEYNSVIGPCPSCVCKKNSGCPSVTCGPMCEKQNGSDGCPTCSCNPLCSAPKCDVGCHLEYDRAAGPCPSCSCPNPDVPLIQCSMPKCEENCRIDYNTKPCPSCVCGVQDIPLLQCSPPKCEQGCHIDYDTKPCPSCTCPNSEEEAIQCSPPKCDTGCVINYDAKPCPACNCDIKIRKSPTQRVRCAPVKCPEGCHEDYTTKPCPSCSCSKTVTVSDIQCSPPRCAVGCKVDYDSKPCPRCVCDSLINARSRILCSPLRCPNGCQADYSVKPCPRCSCDQGTLNLGLPSIMCSPVKCDEPDCKINYSSKPCPSCDCTKSSIPSIMCSHVNCDEPGCTINYSSKPCPSCDCTKSNLKGLPSIMCSPVKCDEPGCTINYSSKPCPSCNCLKDVITNVPSIMCSPVKCDEPGCTINYSTKPCPSCECPMSGVQCSMPKCDPGCQLDDTAFPCPSCVCDRYNRKLGSFAIPNFSFLADPFCRTLSCGFGCKMDHEVTEGERCPSCICDGRAGTMKCLAMQCQWPCQFKRYSPHGCPTCVCHNMSFP